MTEICNLSYHQDFLHSGLSQQLKMPAMRGRENPKIGHRTNVFRRPLYEKIRSAAYDVLERRPSDAFFVMTNALCKTADREVEAWKHVVSRAIYRKVPLVPSTIATEESLQFEKRFKAKLMVNLIFARVGYGVRVQALDCRLI